MTPTRWPRYAPPLAVLSVLAGLWIGHTLEVLQLASGRVELSGGVFVSRSLSVSAFGGIHGYMLGAGAVLILLAAVFSFWLARLWGHLSRALGSTQRQLARLLRTGNAGDCQVEVARASSAPTRVLALWIPMALAQILLYLAQENIESTIQGYPLPGFSVLTGDRWAAGFIQAGVALFLTLAILAATWPIRRKARTLGAFQKILVARCRALFRSEIAASPRLTSERITSLSDILGTHLWQRPPPRTA